MESSIATTFKLKISDVRIQGLARYCICQGRSGIYCIYGESEKLLEAGDYQDRSTKIRLWIIWFERTTSVASPIATLVFILPSEILFGKDVVGKIFPEKSPE